MSNYKGNRGGFKKGGSKNSFEGKKSFGSDKKHGASRKYGGNKGQGDRDTGSVTDTFPATCSECGKRCEVPFRPSQDKPVYCGDCFGAKKNANESRGSKSGGDNSGKGSNYSERSEYKNLPREERPARHDKTRGRGDDGIVDLKRQIADLEVKLDRIIDLMSTSAPAQKEVLEKAEPKKKVKVAKKEVSKKAPPKKAVKKAPAKVAPKKVAKKPATKKAVAKKVVKKPVAKKAAVKKVVAKKSMAKVVKKAAKAVTKKVVKKAKK